MAQRSSEASTEIEELISSSQLTVEKGADLIENLGKAMEDLLSHVNWVGEAVGEINEAASSQVHSLTGVEDSVSELERMTSTNTAMSEETAASTQSLHQAALAMRELTEKFLLPAQNDDDASDLQNNPVRDVA